MALSARRKSTQLFNHRAGKSCRPQTIAIKYAVPRKAHHSPRDCILIAAMCDGLAATSNQELQRRRCIPHSSPIAEGFVVLTTHPSNRCSHLSNRCFHAAVLCACDGFQGLWSFLYLALTTSSSFTVYYGFHCPRVVYLVSKTSWPVFRCQQLSLIRRQVSMRQLIIRHIVFNVPSM